MEKISKESYLNNLNMNLKLKLFLGIFCVAFSVSGYGHVRWFVEEEATENIYFQWTYLYYVLIACAVIYGLLAIYIEKKLSTFFLNRIFSPWNTISQWRLLAGVCGMTLILISLDGVFLAPNIHLTSNKENYLLIQAICGAILISSIKPNYSGFSLLLLCIITVLITPREVWIDYIPEFIAISLALILQKKHPKWSVTLLRIGLGIQLIILAIHNKFISPQLGLQFLELHEWNFMMAIGLTAFDNLLFVFSAGLVELTFGLLILAGLGTRLVILSVGSFFIFSSILLGPSELMGHLPILACCSVLFSLGRGHNLYFSNKKTDQKLREENENSSLTQEIINE